MKRSSVNLVALLILVLMYACGNRFIHTSVAGTTLKAEAPFFWEAANVYFLLTDRFHNGDPSNDTNFGRTKETAVLRGFEGGDLQGIIQKLEAGYFTDLGVNAIWFTPVFEQIHGGTDEGTGFSYPFHGYWPRDWTALDPNFGTGEELNRLVKTAHEQGIRVVMDVILNHIGPVTEKDPVWPEEWVRTSPKCQFNSYETTVSCTLVENLPDVKTGRDAPVALPPSLISKWKQEGRYEQETAELDAFFVRTGYPRAPRYYIIKWLSDFVREMGFDGFRLDTAKHLEEEAIKELKEQASYAFEQWKKENPSRVLDNNPFWMVGEVYGYNLSSKRMYDFGDQQVDYYDHGLNSLINFEFIPDASKSYEAIFSKYDRLLHSSDMRGNGVLNYLSSHDDGNPFDRDRSRAMEAGTKLLLAPGAAQIYYGDETARDLVIEGAEGDATLRSFMNWSELEQNASRSGHAIREVLMHWQKLGQFRASHPAIGAGRHKRISSDPYVFRRDLKNSGFEETVVVGLDLPKGEKTINIEEAFAEGTALRDAYSGQELVTAGKTLRLNTPYEIVLLEKIR